MALSRRIAAAGIFCWATLAGPANADTATLYSLRTGIYADHARLVLDLSGPTSYKIMKLDNPRRLVVELEQTQLAGPIDQWSFKGTAITGASDSKQGESGLQLVFELAHEVTTNTFPLKPHLDRGDRIVIDLYKSEPARLAVQETTAIPAAARAPKQRGQDQPDRRHPPPRAAQQPVSPLAFSGTWTQEWAVAIDNYSTQKFEAIVEPRLDMALPGNMNLTGIVRLRGDTQGDLGPDASRPQNYSDVNGPWYNDAHGEFNLRELYLDAYWGTGFWRIGKQQVVWGQADGIKVMDVVNPQNYREFIMDDLDDSRIPLWMLNAELPAGPGGTLQFLWIPDTTYHELAEVGTPYAFTSRRLVPVAPPGIPTEVLDQDKPDSAFNDSDAGLRYSTFLGGWDVTLNYLYQYQNFPVPYQVLRITDSGFTGVVAPEYERNHLAGTTLSNVFGDVTLRAEMVYNSDTYHISSDLSDRGVAESGQFTSVLGLDWQLGSIDTLISAQWFQSHLFDYNSDILVDQTEHNLSLLYRRTFSNETWRFDALGLYSPNHGDRWIQLSLNYMLRSNLEIWLGGDFFGGDKDGVYGQFSEEDRVLIGLELGL